LTQSTVYLEDYEHDGNNGASKEKEKMTIILGEANNKTTQSREGTAVSEENRKALLSPKLTSRSLYRLQLTMYLTILPQPLHTPPMTELSHCHLHLLPWYKVCEHSHCKLLLTFSFPLVEDQELDEDTETWPVPKELIKDFNKVKNNYRVLPLVVYDADDHFVEPLQVNDALKHALVEIHFGVVHYKIGRAGETHDSFTAVPKQILILKTPPVQTPSPYKRKNVRSGPVRPKGFEDFRKDTPSDQKGKNVASGSRA
jgi:hypothetical protein